MGAINEVAKGPIIAGQNPPSCFSLFHTVSLAFFSSIFHSVLHQLIDSNILTILSISSFKINKLNPLPALTAPCALMFSFQIYLIQTKLL